MSSLPVDGVTTLDTLESGQNATIDAILVQGDMARRIREMGCIPGKHVEVLGRAPLQDPMAIRLGGSSISLRRSEAQYVRVALLSARKEIS